MSHRQAPQSTLESFNDWALVRVLSKVLWRRLDGVVKSGFSTSVERVIVVVLVLDIGVDGSVRSDGVVDWSVVRLEFMDQHGERVKNLHNPLVKNCSISHIGLTTKYIEAKRTLGINQPMLKASQPNIGKSEPRNLKPRSTN